MNPYEILSITPPGDDETIRKHYLELVRQYPPEQYPERFAEINRAFEMIKKHEHRLCHTLFPPNLEERSPMAVVINHLKHRRPKTHLSVDKLKEYLQKCAID